MTGELVIGRVGAPFGVRGEVRVTTGAPDALRPGLNVRLRLPGGEEMHVRLDAIRAQGNAIVGRFSVC